MMQILGGVNLFSARNELSLSEHFADEEVKECVDNKEREEVNELFFTSNISFFNCPAVHWLCLSVVSISRSKLKFFREIWLNSAQLSTCNWEYLREDIPIDIFCARRSCLGTSIKIVLLCWVKIRRHSRRHVDTNRGTRSSQRSVVIWKKCRTCCWVHVKHNWDYCLLRWTC